MKKKGVSPVIATILLILIAFILALIIFVWARGFVTEQTEKFGSAVEFACDDIIFTAEVRKNDNNLYITNKGNVPIYGAEVRAKRISSIQEVGTFEAQTIARGDAKKVSLESLDNVNGGDELIVVPIILGESGEYKKAHICDEEFGETIIVK